jgi:mRNA interferase MazF
VAGFVKGDIVVVPFPFSDFSQTKRRPALVVAAIPGDDLILCQITSQAISDLDAIPLGATEMASGSLSQPSNIRPNKLFTADSHIILYTAGSLRKKKLDLVIDKIVEVVRR